MLLLQLVQNAAAAGSSVMTLTMPTVYALPTVQPVPRVTPVCQTTLKPEETITLSPSRVTTLPPLMPAKSVATVLASGTPVAPPATVAFQTSTTAMAAPSASSTAINSSPTASNRPVLRVIIPNTRGAAASDDVSWLCAFCYCKSLRSVCAQSE